MTTFSKAELDISVKYSIGLTDAVFAGNVPQKGYAYIDLDSSLDAGVIYTKIQSALYQAKSIKDSSALMKLANQIVLSMGYEFEVDHPYMR